jgi:hypothetical protein
VVIRRSCGSSIFGSLRNLHSNLFNSIKLHSHQQCIKGSFPYILASIYFFMFLMVAGVRWNLSDYLTGVRWNLNIIFICFSFMTRSISSCIYYPFVLVFRIVSSDLLCIYSLSSWFFVSLVLGLLVHSGY